MSDTTRAITAHHAELARDLRAAVEAAETAPSERSAAALVEFLDRDLLPHAKSEELHLYPLLDPIVAAHARPTETMSIDHEFIARYRDEIARARADLGGARGDAAAGAATRLARAAAALEALVEVHLAKEERAYLPLLAKHTSDADQAALLRRMHGGDGGSEEAVIDVRTIEPARRHPLIFEAFAGLAAGQTMVVAAPHDPKHLRQQLEAQHPAGFGWDYLEEGPTWRVRLTKRG
jgi:uncharacterized protein (DUF2249 family)/hemerythrin-like domain-containing protein